MPFLAVASDVTENLLTLLTLALIACKTVLLASWSALLLLVANGFKWSALIVSGAIILAALLSLVIKK